jgi:hypothetical protein
VRFRNVWIREIKDTPLVATRSGGLAHENGVGGNTTFFPHRGWPLMRAQP